MLYHVKKVSSITGFLSDFCQEGVFSFMLFKLDFEMIMFLFKMLMYQIRAIVIYQNYTWTWLKHQLAPWHTICVPPATHGGFQLLPAAHQNRLRALTTLILHCAPAQSHQDLGAGPGIRICKPSWVTLGTAKMENHVSASTPAGLGCLITRAPGWPSREQGGREAGSGVAADGETG